MFPIWISVQFEGFWKWVVNIPYSSEKSHFTHLNEPVLTLYSFEWISIR